MARFESLSQFGLFALVMICMCEHIVAVKALGFGIYNCGMKGAFQLAG
jgi:hypothetical protein